MKTDTEYFHLALDAWCKAHVIGRDMPITASQLSEILRNAQALKVADRNRLEPPTPTA